MANVRKLMRLAAEFEAHEGRDLRGFLELRRGAHGARRARGRQAALQAEEHDGVRVMTVHAAKGLEFPVVAVADLGRRLSAGGGASGDRASGASRASRRRRRGRPLRAAPRTAPGPSRCGSGSWSSSRRASREADAEEACRLTYVAATPRPASG